MKSAKIRTNIWWNPRFRALDDDAKQQFFVLMVGVEAAVGGRNRDAVNKLVRAGILEDNHGLITWKDRLGCEEVAG